MIVSLQPLASDVYTSSLFIIISYHTCILILPNLCKLDVYHYYDLVCTLQGRNSLLFSSDHQTGSKSTNCSTFQVIYIYLSKYSKYCGYYVYRGLGLPTFTPSALSAQRGPTAISSFPWNHSFSLLSLSFMGIPLKKKKRTPLPNTGNWKKNRPKMKREREREILDSQCRVSWKRFPNGFI